MSALSHVYIDRARGGRRCRLYARRQTLAALAVSAVAGFAIFVTSAESLFGGAVAAPPAAKSPPPGWIDIAFADLDAASARSAIHPQPAQTQNTRKQNARKPSPCADLVYYFLNKNCSVKRVGSARRDFGRRAVAARTVPAIISQDAARSSERVTFAATSTVATD